MDPTTLFSPIARDDPAWEWQGTRWERWPSIDLMQRRVVRLFPGARKLFHRGGVRWMVGDSTVAEIRGMERNRGLWEGWTAEATR